MGQPLPVYVRFTESGNPPCDFSAGMLRVLEPVLPDALFLETAEEPLDQSVLLQRAGRYELLLQAVVSTLCAEPAALED